MTLAALAFAAGVAALQQQAALPAPLFALALPALALAAFRWPRTVVLLAFALGFAWAALLAAQRLADRLSPELEGRDIDVAGVVASLPALGERSVRFEFDVESADAEGHVPGKLLLSWYRSAAAAEEDDAAILSEAVHPGERWLFTVRLRRPHGNVNPEGFDYEAWLLERGIGATGYVRQRGERRLLGERNSLSDRIEQAREAVRGRFLEHLGPTPAAGILIALAIGDQRSIPQDEWRLFNLTGVTHLMSISGLHVTLVSALLAWLVAAAWRRIPPAALALPARKAAALAAIAGALGYTLLAGFGVPAQRTCYMVSIVALALWSGRISSPWRVLALALAAVLAIDPWAPLAPGLWLSFGAVLLIFYVATGWSAAEPAPLQWIRVQWAITAGLAPAVLLLFGQVSVAGPLANALAIPVVSAVITPLALLAAVIPADWMLDLASWLTQWLLQFLEWCSALPGALWQQHVPASWTVALAFAGVAWLLAPRGVPWRGGGLALIAPAFLVMPPAPREGEAWITTLDVGQGLAIVVRTANRALLYDAGPAFGPEADSGSRVIVPLLRAKGITRLDAMVLSHEDGDHIGGALSVLEALPADELRSSLPRGHPLNALAPAWPCARGTAWQWDGVRFEILHPGAELPSARRNDGSCVLRISNARGAALLTGDIERAAEWDLVQHVASRLPSDVLVVPHHGSRTSSSPAFIAAVAPRWAIVAAGYRNRFRHPNAEVLERYRAAGSAIARTDLDGAVTVTLSPQGVALVRERLRHRRYWLQ
ncbi:MAG TPA: DNA internalization-related competence protein ComEC/Rec2 [Burkholderiales bacterium]|nr:DNA internalization-related competence protein ComEC/Rec2 [Burkholderiales bacterium]